MSPTPRSSAHDMFAYWLMPHGLRGLLTTVFWPSATGLARPPARAGRTAYPGPLVPFLALAPGTHRISFTHPEQGQIERSLRVGAGEQRAVRDVLQDTDAPTGE